MSTLYSTSLGLMGNTQDILRLIEVCGRESPSPLLFVIIMEYLYMVLQKLRYVLYFNFHSKCEKLNIINLNFADDLLLFARGDKRSIQLIIDAFEDFFTSTGLRVNPTKCKVYFGNVADNTKQEIHDLTKYIEGLIPFKYPGVPLTSKKLFVNHCLILVEKLVGLSIRVLGCLAL